jgi:hydrogenase nickel incorporation protein HypA/HybF
MHEASVTQALLDLVLVKAREHHAAEVKEVHVSVGVLSTFIDESIELWWRALSADTIAANSRLVFRHDPSSADCYLESIDIEPEKVA